MDKTFRNFIKRNNENILFFKLGIGVIAIKCGNLTDHNDDFYDGILCGDKWERTVDWYRNSSYCIVSNCTVEVNEDAIVGFYVSNGKKRITIFDKDGFPWCVKDHIHDCLLKNPIDRETFINYYLDFVC